jgi:hypothetical protein
MTRFCARNVTDDITSLCLQPVEASSVNTLRVTRAYQSSEDGPAQDPSPRTGGLKRPLNVPRSNACGRVRMSGALLGPECRDSGPATVLRRRRRWSQKRGGIDRARASRPISSAPPGSPRPSSPHPRHPAACSPPRPPLLDRARPARSRHRGGCRIARIVGVRVVIGDVTGSA